MAICRFQAWASLLVCLPLAAENWPQWRGPASQGISAESNLPTAWSATQNVAWRAKLAGYGASSPIVWGDLVIVTSQAGTAVTRAGNHPRLARDDQALASREHAIEGARMPATSAKGDVDLVVEAFSRSNGRRLWEHRLKAIGPFPELHEKHNLATPTPVADGERVYAWFGNGQIVALDMNGKRIWTRHLGEVAPFENQWGHGSSPMLYRDSLILLCDHVPAAYLLALDKRTGKQLWKVDRGKGRVAHSTPVLVPGVEGAELLVNSSERIDVYSPADGKLLWNAGSERQTPIPTPVSHDGVIYMSRGYRNSDYLALLPGGRIKWQQPSGASYVPSILHYQGLLYMTNEIGVVTCAEASTGERVWRHRLGGIFFASPIAGDGKVYMTSETGETFVLRAGRKPEVLATNDIGERLIASPAIAGGRIFLRSDGTLFAIGKE
jgi:outer membrane protein assembly factor BamB